MDLDAFKHFLIEVIDEEFGPNPVEIAPKWMGGTITLHPSNDSQEKEIPIEVFFKKILTVRDSLRVLEQKINTNASITPEDKASYQSYITKAYGSLTTFNILFKEGRDKFHGSGKGGGGSSKKPKMTMAEAKQKLGLNEY